jgi:NADH:ubiquinone oxidoreductase subunit K
LSTEILLFCALLFYVNDFPQSFQKEVIGILCILVIGASSVGVALLIVLDFILQWFEDKKKAKVNYLQTMEDLNLGGDIEFAEQDLMLAKYGLRRRQNQTTVILGEEGKIGKTDTNISQSVQVQLSEKEDSKDQSIMSPHSSHGSIHHERVNSNTGLLPQGVEFNLEDIPFGSQGNTLVNEKMEPEKIDGIAEIPDDEQYE